MTTELQPSPPGYRAVPGLKDECPGKLYHHGNHLNYNNNSSSNKNRLSPERLLPPSSLSDKSQIIIAGSGNTSTIVDSAYGDHGYCKKNTPGYKNDSG